MQADNSLLNKPLTNLSSFLGKMSVRLILKAKVKPVILVLFVELLFKPFNLKHSSNTIELLLFTLYLVEVKFAFTIKKASECYLWHNTFKLYCQLYPKPARTMPPCNQVWKSSITSCHQWNLQAKHYNVHKCQDWLNDTKFETHIQFPKIHLKLFFSLL